MEKLRWNGFGAETRQMGDFVQAAGATPSDYGVYFRSGNPGKSRKTPSEKHEKKCTPKDEKSCRKGVKMESKW
jgi:hypothetical protein